MKIGSMMTAILIPLLQAFLFVMLGIHCNAAWQYYAVLAVSSIFEMINLAVRAEKVIRSMKHHHSNSEVIVP